MVKNQANGEKIGHCSTKIKAFIIKHNIQINIIKSMMHFKIDFSIEVL